MSVDLLTSLPDEKIFEICQNMDTCTLGQFVQTSSKINRICGSILDKEKRELVSKITEQLLKLSPVDAEFCSLDKIRNTVFDLVYEAFNNPEEGDAQAIQLTIIPIDFRAIDHQYERENLRKIENILMDAGYLRDDT